VAAKLTDLEIVVLNSHTHYDHVGGNHQFETIYGTGTEYTRENAKGRAHHQVAEFVGEGWIWKQTPPGFDPARYESKPFTVTKTVEDGEILDLGGRRIEVLLTPGHAPDALCLLDRENRLLFTGDTYYPATLYAHLPGSDFEAYRETTARLAELSDDVDFVLPAHNEPLVRGDVLPRLSEAFESVARGDATFVTTDGNREYSFDGFSILTK
jgi:glyoxylase-like metal-dependent hydrolase (beta-lactamase superfamily II)